MTWLSGCRARQQAPAGTWKSAPGQRLRSPRYERDGPEAQPVSLLLKNEVSPTLRKAASVADPPAIGPANIRSAPARGLPAGPAYVKVAWPSARGTAILLIRTAHRLAAMALAHVTALPGGGIADLPAGARRGTCCCVKSRDKQTGSEYLHQQAGDPTWPDAGAGAAAFPCLQALADCCRTRAPTGRPRRERTRARPPRRRYRRPRRRSRAVACGSWRSAGSRRPRRAPGSCARSSGSGLSHLTRAGSPELTPDSRTSRRARRPPG